jgi:SpoVK/Ycf46/Vps4 family AAA+-type ATPase
MEQPSGAGSLTENASSVHDLAFGLAQSTIGFSGSGLLQLCEEAAMNALRKNIQAPMLTPQDFVQELL